MLLAQAEPGGDAGAGIVSLLGAENGRRSSQTDLKRPRQGFFQADLDAVKQRAGAAKREHATRSERIIADEAGGDRSDADFGLGKATAAFVAAEIRVIHAR